MTIHRPRICPFERLLDSVPANSVVFDIGCGSGLLLYLLGRDGRLRAGLGIDIEPDAVATGRRALQNETFSNVRLECLAQSEEWPKGPFEVVTMVDVMHHVPPAAQRRFFESAASRVGAGGRLVYKDMGRRPLWMASWNRLHDLIMARQWIHYVSIDQIAAWGRQAGMTEITREPLTMLAYAHELVVFERRA